MQLAHLLACGSVSCLASVCLCVCVVQLEMHAIAFDILNRCKGRCVYLFVYTYVLSYYMYRIHDTDTRSLHVYVVYTFSSRSMLFTHAADIA